MSLIADLEYQGTPLPNPAFTINRRSQKQPHGEFLKGPVPMSWIRTVGKLPGKALSVGVVLFFLAGLKRSTVRIQLSSRELLKIGVNRFAKYRALKTMADAGLITVDSHIGLSPVITILNIPTENKLRNLN